MESSAAGLTFIFRRTKRATLISSSSETSTPDSLDTSILMIRLPYRRGDRRAARLRPDRSPPLVPAFAWASAWAW